jgi:hypothetical protein
MLLQRYEVQGQKVVVHMARGFKDQRSKEPNTYFPLITSHHLLSGPDFSCLADTSGFTLVLDVSTASGISSISYSSGLLGHPSIEPR